MANAFVNATSSGNTQVVAGVAGFSIRVHSALLTNKDTAVIDVHFQSNTTAISATQALAVDGGYRAHEGPQPFIETADGEALNVNLSGAGAVGVDVRYELIT